MCCRGQRDEFIIEDADLGELTAVTISHDSSGISPSWHLDHVEVTPLGPVQQQQQHFTSNSTTHANPSSSGNSSPLHTSQSLQQSLHSRLLRDPGSVGGAGGSSVASTRDAGVTYLFPCGAWLDECLGDGKTQRKLLAAR